MHGLPSVTNTNILVEAKKEYTKHVCNLLAPIIVEGLQTVYDESKQNCEDPEILKSFQQSLKQIPKWNQEIIDREYNRIMEYDNCDILNDLVKAVFITNIKILSSVTNNKHHKIVKIEIPSSKRFIHKCYIESAREIYKDPFLFTHDVSPIEHHRNNKEIYNIVCDGIEESIRILLPVRQILQEYLGDALLDEDDDESLDPGISDTMKQNLQKMVQQEILHFKSSIPPPPPPTATPTRTPPRSPPPTRSPLFPHATTTTTTDPSPLMKMLTDIGTRTHNHENESDDTDNITKKTSDVEQIQHVIKQLTPRYRSKSRSRSPSRIDDNDDQIKKKIIKTFRVDPRNRTQSVTPGTDNSLRSSTSSRDKEQDDIKAIVLGQKSRGGGRSKYERDYTFPLKENKYKRKSLQFTIENRTDSDDDDDDNDEKRKSSRKKIRDSADLDYFPKKKNLFFDEPEDFSEQ